VTTVNDELQTRMAELQQTNDDLHNVLGGIGESDRHHRHGPAHPALHALAPKRC
jgi:hypothetical protein